MADAALSKSLDDLIKEQRDKAKKGPRKSNGPKPHLKGKGSSKQQQKKHNKKQKPAPRISAGPIAMPMKKGKKKQRRGPGSAPRVVVDPESKNPALRAARLEGNETWKHDMAKFGAGNPRRGPRSPSLIGTKLFISNLDYKVSSEDIKELFETIGPLVSHRVHFDRTGRSEGTAEVVFEDRNLAVTAQKRYHSIELDGRPMHIELIEKRTQPEQRVLTSGIMISAGPGKYAKIPRAMAQAHAQAVAQAPRGRGNIRSRVESMQTD